MALRVKSPTARLLRSSRVFSLPQPIRAPGDEPTNISDTSAWSDTSTRSHPTHQSIVTPQSSLCRGDWGLKRPLPRSAATKSSNPVIRVHDIDTIERVTDFASSANYTLSLRKWHEMNLPLNIPQNLSKRGLCENAFDDTVDNASAIAPPAETAFNHSTRGHRSRLENAQAALLDAEVKTKVYGDKSTAAQDIALAETSELLNEQLSDEFDKPRQRWKYRGPWVGGMTVQEFEKWLVRTLSGKRSVFAAGLRRFVAERIVQARHMDMINRVGAGRKVSKVVDEDEIEKTILALRDNRSKHSELSTLIRDYLDLPNPAMQGAQSVLGSQASTMYNEWRSPSTLHPSAGLSYLRTGMFLENHPLLGPQLHHTPITSRSLKVKQGNYKAKLSVGGFVADDRTNFTGFDAARQMQDGYNPRAWVAPSYAYVDPDGRIVVIVSKADEASTSVRNGELGESPRSYMNASSSYSRAI